VKPVSKPVGGEPAPHDDAQRPRWLLLIHQLPHKPPYTRVKIWRRLQALGAIAIKNTVYALPAGDQAREDLEWIVREIERSNGESFIIEARFLHGLRDADVEAMFNAARDADYLELRRDLETALGRLPKRGGLKPDLKRELETELVRLKRRFADVGAIDFFGASGREIVAAVMASYESRLAPTPPPASDLARAARAKLTDRVWVTRRGMFVDRIASAWLIRRFIDPKAHFKYVSGKGYRPEPGELRFDMFEGEYTHEGDACTFEVLVARLGIDDRALKPIAEIVHDIDIKDEKYGHEQTSGIQSLITGIASTSETDDERLERGSKVFDDLYDFFRKRKSST
jgi:hypothetical protein